MNLVGQKAPSFKAPAVVHGKEIVQDFSLQDYEGKKAVVLFFYPKDFTFVCPTEVYAFQEQREAFAERGVEIVGCSTDTEETHWAWLHVARSQGGIQGVTYPLVADTSKTIAANFGVLGGTWFVDEQDQLRFEGNPVAHRGVFLIDKQGIVRHVLINDLSLGRNIDEILRTVDMMQHVDTHGEVCPVNWQAGKKAFKPTQEALLAYLSEELVGDGRCDEYLCDEEGPSSGCCAQDKHCQNPTRCGDNGSCQGGGCGRRSCACRPAPAGDTYDGA